MHIYAVICSLYALATHHTLNATLSAFPAPSLTGYSSLPDSPAESLRVVHPLIRGMTPVTPEAVEGLGGARPLDMLERTYPAGGNRRGSPRYYTRY